MLQDQTDKVKLFMSCTQLKPNLNEKVDPLIRVHIQDKDMWNLIGETELLKDCQEPKFGIPISVDFAFGTQQTLLFEIINFSSGQPDLLGIARATLGKIINAPKHFWVSEILDKEEREVGKLIIQRQRDGQARKCLSMQWAGVKLMNTDGLFDKSDPYLKFFKERHPGEYVQVHETEVIMNKLNPVWKPFEIMSADLADGEDRPIKVECWDWEKKKQHQFIGDCMITLGKLLHNETEFELHNPKKKKKTGKLRLLSLNAREEPGFLDFLLGGQSLKLFIGMNFSSPGGFYNCDANSSHILHDDNSFNEFQNAMYAVSEAVLEYDVDQSVPMYGFGGIPKFPMINSRGVSNCFPCSGNPNQPRAVGLEGITNTYSHAVQNVDLGGSTNVAPLLKEVMQFSQVQKRITNGVYTVLVMLMNSDAQDIQQAINYLVDSSQLPLSVLFVGIGEGPFIHMENLNKELVDSTGKKAQRHLAQFVTFKDFKGDVEQFTQFVMEKIPGQLVEYMKSIGKRPGALIKADLSQVENSGRVLHTMQTWSPAYKNASFALTMTNQSFEKWKKPGSYGNILNMTEVSRTSASNLSGSDEGENVPMQNSEQDINVQNVSILKAGNFSDEREIQTFNRYSIEPHPMSNVNEKPLMSRNPLAELNFGGNGGKDSVMTENQSYHPQIYPTFENNDVTMIK